MERLDILLSCANAQVVPEIISMIRDHPDFAVTIHGMDAGVTKGNIAELCCDNCYDVPLGSDPAYYQVVRRIVVENGIRILFPASDEECMVLSRNRADLSTLDCTLCSSEAEVNEIASNKYLVMRRLRELGISSGDFYLPDGLDDLDDIATKLGYPERDFIIKPMLGRGSRGFRVISYKADAYANFRSGKHHRISLEELKTIFRDNETDFRNYLLMEYYPGEKFSADVLVSCGKVISMVIRTNGTAPKTNPPTQRADIVFDPDVRAFSTRLVEELGFDFFVQIECGRRLNGNLGLIEINTRSDATLPITAGLGINFYREMITYGMTGRMRSGIPDYHEYPERLRFLRYWKHEFLRT